MLCLASRYPANTVCRDIGSENWSIDNPVRVPNFLLKDLLSEIDLTFDDFPVDQFIAGASTNLDVSSSFKLVWVHHLVGMINHRKMNCAEPTWSQMTAD
jgi:hypothetical protein